MVVMVVVVVVVVVVVMVDMVVMVVITLRQVVVQSTACLSVSVSRCPNITKCSVDVRLHGCCAFLVG